MSKRNQNADVETVDAVETVVETETETVVETETETVVETTETAPAGSSRKVKTAIFMAGMAIGSYMAYRYCRNNPPTILISMVFDTQKLLETPSETLAVMAAESLAAVTF